MTPDWVWTIVSVAGVLAALWGFGDAWGDLRALGTRANGRRRIARGYMRAEAIRGLIAIGWTGVGIFSILSPRDPSWSPGTIVLIVTNAAVLSNSLLDARDRLALRRQTHPAPVKGQATGPETPLQRQDREVGDERRYRQAEDAEEEE